jgi:hypothetical protein
MRDHLNAIEFWQKQEDWDRVVFYRAKLAALVELLEIYDCGSIGGFGEGQPRNQTLPQRSDWLLRKYQSNTHRKGDV